MSDDKKYLNFPITMLRDLYVNSDSFFSDAFDVGIYLYSKTLNGGELARYKEALNYLGITQVNPKRGIETAKSILSGSSKVPMTGIEKEMLFDYYKNHKEDYSLVCLGAFLGIKSIIGTKPYCKTNKRHIHARMFGYPSVSDIKFKLEPLEKKYQTRWHMDKVLLELQENWHLKCYSNHQRGMYISFDLDLKELAIISEKNKHKTKRQQLKARKEKAKTAALRHINDTLTTP